MRGYTRSADVPIPSEDNGALEAVSIRQAAGRLSLETQEEKVTRAKNRKKISARTTLG